MRRLEQVFIYMDRNTIPNINTTSFAFEQNIKHINTRLEILQFQTFNYNTTTTSFAFEISKLHCNANDSLIN
jgi:hypothetical protein